MWVLSECIRAAVDFLRMSIDIINLIKSEHLQPILVYRRYLQLKYKWHLCPAPTQSPGEIRGKEVELALIAGWTVLAAELFRNSCFSDIVLVTLFRTAVGTATTPPPPSNSVVLAVLTVSSVFTGRSAGTSYSYPPPHPPHPRHL